MFPTNPLFQMGVFILTILFLLPRGILLILKQLAFLLVHGFPDHQEPLWTAEELCTPHKMLAFELEDVLEWEFEVAAPGKGINLYHLGEERCVDIWVEERASLL